MAAMAEKFAESKQVRKSSFRYIIAPTYILKKLENLDIKANIL